MDKKTYILFEVSNKNVCPNINKFAERFTFNFFKYDLGKIISAMEFKVKSTESFGFHTNFYRIPKQMKKSVFNFGKGGKNSKKI